MMCGLVTALGKPVVPIFLGYTITQSLFNFVDVVERGVATDHTRWTVAKM